MNKPTEPFAGAAEYLRAALDYAVARGMAPIEVARAVMHGRAAEFNLYLEGGQNGTLPILARAAEVTGLSLDALDPRLNRGMALAAKLGEAAAANNWPTERLAPTLGMSAKTLKGVLNTGRLGPQVKPIQAVRLCDLMEGRIDLLTPEEIRKRRQAAEAEARSNLPPEAQGDPGYLRAKRAFAHCVHPNPKLFRLRRAKAGLFVADGPAIHYRLELLGNAVRVTGSMRKTGIQMLQRDVYT